jgi:hypothetical protein
MELVLGNQTANRPADLSSTERLPWHCYAVVLGAACIPIGALWDISWHSTIGRDTFWTPAHILIYLGGLVPGLSSGWLILKATFSNSAYERASAVRFWGLHGPLGAWVTIWGTVAMLTSAPFDDWWHNTYGLDVEILSPPHTILALGMYAVAVGALLLVLSWQNRSAAFQSQRGSGLFVLAGGILLTMSTIIVTEKSFPNQQHGAIFYQASCAIYPLYLVIAATTSTLRWAATRVAAIYFGLVVSMLWILPLFSAQPKLAPIYNPVDHMVAPIFPLLLVVPALAIDWLLATFGKTRGRWRDWLLAAMLGAVFLLLFLAVQWNLAKFLLTPGAENWVFASDRHWPYFVRPGDWQHSFWRTEIDSLTPKALAIAWLLAVFKSRIALWIGSWMRKVRR